MHYPKRPVALIGILGISAVLLFAKDSAAAAPVYFDLGGLILYGFLYLLGLIALPLFIGFSKEKSTKRFWSWTFAAYIVIPVTYVCSDITLNKMRNERILEERKNGDIQNREAFGSFCKDRKRVVYSKAPPSSDASLVVRIEKNFNGVEWQFNAFPIFDFMRSKSSLCQAIGLRNLEGIYNGNYSEEKKGYEKEVRRYLMCSNEKWLVDSEVRSRYELVLGETGRKASVPWGNEGGLWMANSSVRIVDKSTGQTLAEDTMYFLRYDTGEGGCPRGLEQITELIADVFPRQ